MQRMNLISTIVLKTRFAKLNRFICTPVEFSPLNIKSKIGSSQTYENCRQVHLLPGDFISPGCLRGYDYILDTRLNKGLRFTLKERQMLGLQGFLPPCFRTIEEQLEVVTAIFASYKQPINKYIFLMSIYTRQEDVFFHFLSQQPEMTLPYLYTPTMALVAQHFGLFYQKAQGVFLTIHDRGQIYRILQNWPESEVRVIMVTDGQRVMGMGDYGCAGMAIVCGKLPIYTAFGKIKHHYCLGVSLDVGTDNIDVLADPLYVGLRMKRVRGKKYFDFLDEFMQAVRKRFGRKVLIHFEDFSYRNGNRLLKKYHDKYCILNNNIQSSGANILGGIYASSRITCKSLADSVILFVGAGSSAIGCAHLIRKALIKEGCDEDETVCNIWMMNKEGLLTKGSKGLNKEQIVYTKDHSPIKSVEEAVKKLKPNILVGASGAGGIFTEKVIRAMGKINKRPVIFALSSPLSYCECTAEQAYKYTEGRVLFAAGVPFPPVIINGKTYKSQLANDINVFPGIALGVISVGAKRVDDNMFLIAARKIGDFNTEEELKHGSVFPSLTKVSKLSFEIAVAVAKYAYKNDLSMIQPQPEDIRKHIFNNSHRFVNHNVAPYYVKWPKTQELDLIAIQKETKQKKKERKAK